MALATAGLSPAEAIARLSLVDQDGLLIASRGDLEEHNQRYAQDRPAMSFVEALRDIRPHVLIGATGAPGTFTREVIETMSEINERPTIFALSNPTSRAECTAEEAYAFSNGRAIFASGSPFPAVELEGRRLSPGQANDVYILPGVGLGVLACQTNFAGPCSSARTLRLLASARAACSPTRFRGRAGRPTPRGNCHEI